MDDTKYCLNGDVEIKYKIWKSATSRQKLVLIHPLAMDLHFWTDCVQHLMPYFEILALDCRGHGGSSKPAGPYSSELFAKDLSIVLNHVGWSTAIIAGASMGGCVALNFAGLYPEKIDGLGLIDTTAYYGKDAPKVWEERAQKALTHGMDALIDFQKSRWVSEAFLSKNPTKMEQVIDVFCDNDPVAYAETCRMLGQLDLRYHLSGFDFPVIILVGEDDYATPPAMAHHLASNLKNSKLKIIRDARHFTPLEYPNLVAEHLRSLI